MTTVMKLVILIVLFFIAISANTYASEQRSTFDRWLEDFKKEAKANNISQQVLDKALNNVQPIEKIIELDRKQPENTITFAEYIQNKIPPRRKKGQQMLQKHQQQLEEVSEKYGVQPRFIVALWGIETVYGANTGGFYVPASLATLAYDGRRSELFRKELMTALQIIDEGHIPTADMKGSWAGAMGQSQFMPSSFMTYAVDHDGDGKRDIWQTKADVFASIANYLSSEGWDDNTTWGRRVKLPKTFDVTWMEAEKPLEEWQNLGFRRMDGRDLPKRDIPAMLIMPDGEKGDAFLVYENYKTLLKWNRSNYFALSVGLLSDAIN